MTFLLYDMFQDIEFDSDSKKSEVKAWKWISAMKDRRKGRVIKRHPEVCSNILMNPF